VSVAISEQRRVRRDVVVDRVVYRLAALADVDADEALAALTRLSGEELDVLAMRERQG
jgi:hypothetical protein